jgi:hypothetical protein
MRGNSKTRSLFYMSPKIRSYVPDLPLTAERETNEQYLRLNFMEIFNIKIGFGRNEVTLTIVPAGNYYKVIYYGGILGAVRPEDDNETWEKVPDEEIEAGGLPFYKHDLSADRLHVVLDNATVHRIGEEINAN